MYAINWIIEKLNDISGFFYSIYLEVWSWPFPFYYAANSFYYLSYRFNDLAWYVYVFGNWVQDVTNKIATFLTAQEIYNFLYAFLWTAEQAYNWVSRAFQNVWAICEQWWASTQHTVLAWIEEAKRYADSLIGNFTAWLAALQVAWDAFKGMIPTIEQVIYWWGNWQGAVLQLISNWWAGVGADIQGLIDSAFALRESLWAGWQEWRDKVAEFFTEPLDYLWQRFTDWFLGPEG